ncbi:hypothetical protein C8035_v008924 [Colletotrichum spinosum]|uniref:Uncharacterized protein n=1 Tax=Colletotrichum spinosum TaxID=1347390 RepID=A0A4V3HQR0_9PEZI|nr:hypothetical protein C8035_v008924 [Colletotrichum spinosum]
MALSPRPAHQASFIGETYSTPTLSFSHASAFQSHPMSTSVCHTGILAVAGRKRPRDEAAPNLAADERELRSQINEVEDEWQYGPGMTLIKKSGYIADAGSQSGTWVEDQAAEKEARIADDAIARLREQQLRPSLRSNKSLRLERGAKCDIAPASGQPTAPSESFPVDQSSQPIVDRFTMHLGVGWRHISDDQHIQAAARGWARYIENHYPVSSPAIRLESRGLQSYLVEAVEGFFLFSEDLRQGRFVSKDAESAMRNLKCCPPAFDGSEIMMATESSPASETCPETHSAHSDSHMEM